MGNKDNKERVWRTVPGKEGVVYREHKDRKNGRRADRFLAIRYRCGNGKRAIETLGWASDGWTVDKAVSALREIKENIRLGKRPQSLKEKRAMIEAERIEQERFAARAKLDKITFGELAEMYAVWADDNRVTNGVRPVLERHVLPVLGNIPVAGITVEHVNELRRIVSEKHPVRGNGKPDTGAFLAPQTVLHIIKIVREVFNFALETSVPGHPGVMLFSGNNPARMSKRGRGVRIPQKDSRRLRVLNDKEINKLLSYRGARSEYQDIYDMILLSLDIGLRAGEVCHLLRESVDPVSGSVRILKGSDADRSTKGGESRIVHAGGLFPECVEMLRRRIKEPSSSPYLFPGRNGGRRDNNSLGRAMRRIAEKLEFNTGVTDRQNIIVWHTLRHTYATRMLEKGCDIYMLKEFMGHASVTTTEGYLHLCDQAKRRAALAGKAKKKRAG